MMHSNETPKTVDTKVSVRSLDFYYGTFKGLKGVNLDIAEHKVTAFIGPSGCGKSTLLRSVNRMNDLVEGVRVAGDMKLGGRSIHDPALDVIELRKRMGMVFQKPNPFPKSIFENVAYGPRIHGLAGTRADLDEIVQTSLRKAGLWEEVKDRLRSEERRVGKECRSRWSPYH